MTKTKRVAGYVRLSKETEDTTSPQRQRQAIRRLCADRGWTLAETFEDIDVSAFNGKHRPGLERLMSRLGDFDAIVFWKLDRLSRSSVEAGQIAERCKEAAVDLVATDMDLDTTSAGGEFIYTLMAAAAQMESRRTSERSRSMTAYKRERGEWLGRPPYGWKVHDKRLVTDRQQQAAIRRAARTFVAGGTYGEAAQTLGVAAPSVAQRIMGTARVQTALGDLGDELATAMRSRRTGRAPNSPRSLLGGIARCAECGGPLRRCSTRAARREGRWYAYRCPTPGHVGISGGWLEEHVSTAVLGAIDLKALARRMRVRANVPKAAEVAGIEARIEELEDMVGDGTLTREAFRRQRDRQLAKLADVRAASADDAPDLPLDLARRLPEVWPQMTVQERRDVIRAVVRRVVVAKGPTPNADRVEIDWRA